MKFTNEVIINAPKNVVVKLFQDEKYYEKWQEGFIGMTHLSGTPGENGAKTEMKYKMGKGEMIIIETIIENNLPHNFYGNYWHKSTENTMEVFFHEIDPTTTRYESHVEYIRFTGFMLKVIKTIMPGMFKKQVQKWMVNFKNFVEEFEDSRIQ
ncbi:MAG: SRPBCC family protein [Saprospiraceae bacterium]|nr:SRPBCC family protein [Bacteroidia bacterium]NNL92370.1 SRPBCC family protein [Saprospiraceae bacterium]